MRSELSFFLINVYGPMGCREKRKTRLEIEAFVNECGASVGIIGGDFNTILKPEEKRGGVSIRLQSQVDFEFLSVAMH